jgi:hypothetical protein
MHHACLVQALPCQGWQICQVLAWLRQGLESPGCQGLVLESSTHILAHFEGLGTNARAQPNTPSARRPEV